MNKLWTNLKSWYGVVVLIFLIGTLFTLITLRGINISSKVVDKASIGGSMVTPKLKVTKLSLSPKPLVTKIPDTNVPTLTPTLSPSPTQSPTPNLSTTPTPPYTPTPNTKLKPSSTAKNSGRVVINEIAWSGTSASATGEWIELYNAESEPIDISSWHLVSDDNSPDIVFSEGTIIKANSYFIIERTDDNAIRDITADLVVGFGQGGLNNAGEMVRLFDSTGVVADLVGDVNESWYFGDSSSKNSMERIDPMKAGNIHSNWKSFSGTPVSIDANGNNINGTPKAKNSMAVSPTPSPSQTPTPTSTPVSTPSSSVTPTPSLTPTPTPSLTPTPTPTSSPTPTASPTPEPSGLSSTSVVINEIDWMGTSASANDEWIELYNTTSNAIDLSGWTLKSKDGTPNIFLSGNIGPLGFYLLERTADTTISNILADKIYTGALGNSGESLELRDGSGNLKDSGDFSSGWPSGDNTTKSSMERINPNKSGDNSTNWATNNGSIKNGHDAGGGTIKGTPRSQNSVVE